MARDARCDVCEDRFAVSVVMVRDEVTVGRWQVPRWRVLDVLAGTTAATARAGDGLLIRDENGRRHYWWNGFELRLHRDAAESYWLNLVGRHPSLFVVCREGPADGQRVPVMVTANHDEAGAYMEADATVMSAPMPAQVRLWLEAYVAAHFRPLAPKTRRRAPWGADEQQEWLPPRGGRH